MQVGKTLQLFLDEEDLDRLTNGGPLEAPLDDGQRMVIYPPHQEEKTDATDA